MAFRLYLDESGCHNRVLPGEADVGKRYLGIVGVTMSREHASLYLHPEFEKIKRAHLDFDPDEGSPIFHLSDIIGWRKEFRCLDTAPKFNAFCDDLLHAVSLADFSVVVVVIDKATHGARSYRTLEHPYHYCMHVMLERYCGRLRLLGTVGDVMAEARGGKEDRTLKEEYSRVHGYGTNYLKAAEAKARLSSRELKLKRKEKNIAGLQLADLLANPLRYEVLFRQKIVTDKLKELRADLCKIAQDKYNHHPTANRVKGWGRVFLS